MKNKAKLLECLFGHHQYSKELTGDKHENEVYLCKVCKRSGYYRRRSNSLEVWYTYNGKGNLIHSKGSNGFETWYDDNGDCTCIRFTDGEELRFDE